ncbi:DUF4153 domain-containing protein [Flavobacterium aciduliphilum]|uniref:Uncharacterized protein DUF4153 n=1 Tax=Flavobacterium aciduliphilum TaxID=1101402 RepID=A0A328YGH2_9FLAO|nr:DUF4153 domain-containing protein [Flavobacterium aciduliphilum]RAR71815.1 uncharacterized protein DUF4153 [Flavobacterium aciduliphilum]
MKNKLDILQEKTKALLLNYPLVLLLSLATVIVIICGIENEPKKEEAYFLMRLGITFALGISSQFALKMLAQRIKKGFVWQLVGLLFLVVFFFIFPRDEKNFSENYGFIIVPTFILSHLLVAFISFTKKEHQERNFWEYNKNLFVNLFLTAIFTGVLTGGVQLALVAIQELFNIHFEGKIYAETFATLSIFGSSVIFLLFGESGLEYLEKEGTYPVILKFFTQFILIPLLIIYAVILYFYCSKIIIHWELPRGWVSYLVLAYSIVGIFALLLVHPLQKEKTRSWIILFSKIFYYTLIPLIALLFVAIFTRVLQYGFTEPRYFVLLISVWLTSVMFYFIFLKKATIKFIPISLFIFGVFALIFPYFNAFSVSKRSQENELKQLLIKNKLEVNGKINFNAPIVDSIKTQIENKFEFLNDRLDKEFLKTLVDAKTQTLVDKDKYWYNDLFKNVTFTSKDSEDYLRIYTNKNSYKINDYEYLLKSDYRAELESSLGKDKIKISNNCNDKNPSFEIKINEEAKDVMPQIREFCNHYKSVSKEVLVDDLSFTVDFKNYQIKIIFDSINWYRKDKTINIEGATYLIKSN